jgi:hypothetical protein
MTDAATVKMLPRSRKADDRWMRSILRGQKFEGRGFSKRTVDVLLAHGISAPERLLFMAETELQNMPGIGAISLGEILRYRKQHIRERNQPARSLRGIEGRPVGGLAMPLRLVPLALLLGTSSALAFDTSKLGQWGSLPLDDLTPVIAKSAELQQEINKALSEGNKKQGDVMCVGVRFPGRTKAGA